MTAALPGLLGGIAALAFATPAFAQVELKNDGFTSGATLGFQAGFVAGEMGASRLVPPGGTYQLLSVRFLFGPDATQRDIVLRVYDDSAGTDTPGTQLYSSTFPLTGSSTAVQEVNLSAAAVLVTGAFRVAIEFTAAGAPSIARDMDGSIAADKNFVLSQGAWTKSQVLGLSGDWIIRAVVSAQPPDGGTAGAGGSIGTAGTGGASGTTGSAGAGGTTGTGGTTGAAGTSGAIGTAGASGSTGSAGTGGGTGGNAAMACKVNSECATGQYCLNKTTCTYDCRIDTDCGSNQRCTSLGQCEAHPSGGCSCRVNDTGGLSLTALLGAGLLLARRRSRRPLPRRVVRERVRAAGRPRPTQPGPPPPPPAPPVSN